MKSAVFFKKALGLVILVLIVAGVLYYSFYQKHSTEQWVKVKRGPIISAVYGLGTVTSDNVYHLQVGVTTTVKKLYVKEGDQVKAGQPLVEFVDLPTVTANFDGTITSLPLYVNETVYPQTAVLTLMDLQHSHILVALEQEAAIKIHPGQQVKVTFSGVPNQTFPGTVAAVYPNAQEFNVKILVNNLPKEILPEMSSDVAIILDKKENALLIPNNAINDSTVLVKRGDKTQKVPITIGAVDDNWSELVNGDIHDNDVVLVKS